MAASGVRRWIPGFRSGTWWKAVAASLFYAFCLVGVIAGIATVSWAIAGFYLSVLAIGVLVVTFISYRTARPANVAILAGLLVAFTTFGVSAANAPTQRTSSPHGTAATPESTSPPASSGPVAQAQPSTSATPSPTPTSSPTPSPTPTPVPTPVPTAVPTPVATPTQTPAPPPPPKNLCGAPNNPWGYNFCGGTTISSPPADFCSYFSCIASFWNGRGYVIECNDGTYSKSGGIRGSCSYHGGDLRPLYQ